MRFPYRTIPNVAWVGFLSVAIAALCVVIFTPLPDRPARDAIGQKSTIKTKSPNKTGESVLIDKADYYISGIGSPVILFPSEGREASDFNEIVKQLNHASYQTLTIDPPSRESVPRVFPDDLWDYEVYASGLINPENPVALIGHGYGSLVVRLTAATESANVAAVILLSTEKRNPADDLNMALEQIYNPFKPHRSRLKYIREAYFAKSNPVPEHWIRGWHKKTAKAQASANGDSVGLTDTSDEQAKEIDWRCAGGVPMLIIQPMQDRIAPPENAYALRDRCPQDVEIVEIQNAGHALLPEQTDAVAKAVLAFLAKHHSGN